MEKYNGQEEYERYIINKFQDEGTEVELIIVVSKLLTGFDAPRLKKLYIGRVIKSHNLLQTLTRVNRTYKDFKYGYVVDFLHVYYQQWHYPVFNIADCAITIGAALLIWDSFSPDLPEESNQK